MQHAHIEKVSEKEHKLMLGKHELGTSKTDFDARFHMHAINAALEKAFEEGKESGEKENYNRGYKDGFHDRD